MGLSERFILWLALAESFVIAYKRMRYFEFHLGPSPWVRELEKRDMQLIRKWESSPLLLTFGHLDPTYLTEDFRRNAEKVVGVTESTRYELNRHLRLVSRHPPVIAGLILFLLAAMLILGVVVPVCGCRIAQVLYREIPLGFSVFLYLVLAVWLLVWG